MARRGLVAVMLAAAGLVAAPAARADQQSRDAVEAYLEEAGLTELRARFLERELEVAPSSQRVEIAQRLALVYARLLDEADTTQERQDVEARAERLLAAVPDAASTDLRISLARASFARAEDVVERWRFGDADAGEMEVITSRLETLERTLEQIGFQAHRDVVSLEGREERARETDLDLIDARISEARRRRSAAYYIAGWCARYLAEITGDGRPAVRAMEHFGWLLNASTGDPAELERVPEAFLHYPHVARAMLAISFCNHVVDRRDTADAWYQAVLESERVPRAVRQQMPARRAMSLASGARWAELLTHLQAQRAGFGDLLPVREARLGAALAMRIEAPMRDDAPRRAIAEMGLGDLVAHGELGHVLGLTRAFGADTVGEEGFIARLVRGLLSYENARERHRQAGDSDRPTKDATLAGRYTRAAALLSDALSEENAIDYPRAVGTAALLRGLALYYSGEIAGDDGGGLRAAELFVEAAERAAGSPAEADALWMAIVVLDASIRALENAGRPDDDEALATLRERNASLIEEFLGKFPGHRRATSLVIRQAASGGATDPEAALERLLAVPEDDPMRETALRHAARIAFDHTRAATTPDQRSMRGRQYLDLAEPLLAIDRRLAAQDPEAAERAAIRGRRMLAVALALPVPDLERAERAIDVIQSMAAAGLVDVSDFRAELALRRAELALALGEIEEAEAALEQVAKIDAGLAKQGDRLLYRRALADWRRVRREGEPTRAQLEAASRVTRVGDRLLAGAGELDEAVDEPQYFSLALAVADAHDDLWRGHRDEAARDRAMTLYETVLGARPELRSALEPYARLTLQAGRYQASVDAWRRLVSGLGAGSEEWFAARLGQITALAELDPARAREVMAQHKSLYPNLAPHPLTERFRALAERLGTHGPRGDAP
jgi:hypothetical protein